MLPPEQCPQAGRERMILPQPVALLGMRENHPEAAMLVHMRQTGAVFMMGQNPALPVMPKRPTLLDFFHYRFSDIAFMGAASTSAGISRRTSTNNPLPQGSAFTPVIDRKTLVTHWQAHSLLIRTRTWCINS